MTFRLLSAVLSDEVQGGLPPPLARIKGQRGDLFRLAEMHASLAKDNDRRSNLQLRRFHDLYRRHMKLWGDEILNRGKGSRYGLRFVLELAR